MSDGKKATKPDCPLKLEVCYQSCYFWRDGKCDYDAIKYSSREKGGNMLIDAWLTMIGAFTPEDVRLLKARGCASELFALLEAFDKLAGAWRRTEPIPINKTVWADVQTRLGALRDALREGSAGRST